MMAWALTNTDQHERTEQRVHTGPDKEDIQRVRHWHILARGLSRRPRRDRQEDRVRGDALKKQIYDQKMKNVKSIAYFYIIPNNNSMTRIMDRDSVLYWLSKNVSYQAAIATEDKITYSIGIKKEHGGQRFDDYVLVDTLEEILSSQVLRELECHVTTHMIEKEHLYYTGAMV